MGQLLAIACSHIFSGMAITPSLLAIKIFFNYGNYNENVQLSIDSKNSLEVAKNVGKILENVIQSLKDKTEKFNNRKFFKQT